MARPSPRPHIVVLLLAALTVSAGCGNSSPAAPERISVASTAPGPGSSGVSPLTTYHLSGVVTDDSGVPRPNVFMMLTFAGSTGPDASYWQAFTRSDAAGRYEMSFTARANAVSGPQQLANIVAFATAWNDLTPGYDADFQYITSTTPSIHRDFRVARALHVTAGESLSLEITPGNPICSNNAQDMHPWPEEWICQNLHILAPASGRLVVTARPSNYDGLLAMLQNPEDPFTRGTATIAYDVKAGEEVVVCVELPFGTPLRHRFELTTALQ